MTPDIYFNFLMEAWAFWKSCPILRLQMPGQEWPHSEQETLLILPSAYGFIFLPGTRDRDKISPLIIDGEGNVLFYCGTSMNKCRKKPSMGGMSPTRG